MLGNHQDLTILKQISFQLPQVDSQESTNHFSEKCGHTAVNTLKRISGASSAGAELSRYIYHSFLSSS